MFVGHEAGKPVTIGLAGGVIVVGEQTQTAVGGPIGTGALCHDKD